MESTSREVIHMVDYRQELQAKLDQALAAGDYKAVTQYGNQLHRIDTDKAQATQQATSNQLAAVKLRVQAAIIAALEDMIQDGSLDLAHGVYFNWTFGDEPATRLTKPTNKPTTRVIRHPEISTAALVRLYGNRPYPEVKGSSFADQYFTNLNANFRFVHIRTPLLALHLSNKV